ncbi:DUF5985 family protein [Herbaspirillum sp. ST 5-3]|uniref:DUF5985 family protein n=1 Tax=Oxalobacteraceae TaxID=75682 RepID=UPI0010A333D9|nr:DUF5985 family protein [Herbaspirillum sp. ST 5-3]
MNDMLVGAIAMGSLVASLFFLRFWRTSGDRFFLYFSLAFFLEAISRVLLGLSASKSEDMPLYYLIRLVAYGLILLAIIRKNSGRDKSG